MTAFTNNTPPSTAEAFLSLAPTLQFGEATLEQRMQIMKLLSTHQLPVNDITASTKLYALTQKGSVVASAGLDVFGAHALVRSVSVEDRFRGKGLGIHIYEQLEREARKASLQTLYLITNTAEKFFAKLGYRTISRNEVPATVVASGQFNGICPASSAIMMKALY